MKILTHIVKVILFFTVIAISGCSDSDDSNDRLEYLSALVDGQEFLVNKSSGTILCQKQLSAFGTVNLSVKALSKEGRTIEFLIQNYKGKQFYGIGDRTGSVEGEFTNGHWLTYAQQVPQEIWSSLYDYNFDNDFLNYIEITEDNGNYITGHFFTENFQASGASHKVIQDGAFELKINR